jgi:hypothetical protein
VDGAQGLREHRRLEQTLHGVVDPGEDRVARKGEDDGVGVERSQPAEGEKRQLEVEKGRRQLEGDDHAHQHAHDAPDQGHQRESADDGIVVGKLLDRDAHQAPPGFRL